MDRTPRAARHGQEVSAVLVLALVSRDCHRLGRAGNMADNTLGHGTGSPWIFQRLNQRRIRAHPLVCIARGGHTPREEGPRQLP